LLVDGEPLSFLIEERHREEPRVPTAAELAREKREYSYHAPRITMIATGALRIVRIDTKHTWSPRRKSWYDHRNKLVETTDCHGDIGGRMISSLYSSTLNKSNFVFDNQFFQTIKAGLFATQRDSVEV
jgi:hypothetical protein